MRMTPQRQVLLRLIGEWPGRFTPIELYDRARKEDPRIGLATVYRLVEVLRRTGSVRPLHVGGRPGYVRCHARHHHHLVCLSCGGVEETALCAAPSAEELEREHGFSPESHELDIYGTCARCAA